MSVSVLTEQAECAAPEILPPVSRARHNARYRVSQDVEMTTQEVVFAALDNGTEDQVMAMMTYPTEHLSPNELAALLAGQFLYERKNPNTRDAYKSDLADWFAFCAAQDVEVLDVRRKIVVVYMDRMGQEPADPDDGPPAKSDATIARRLACLSRFYRYIEAEGFITDNPVRLVDRPQLSRDSQQLGLGKDEALQILYAARDHGPRSLALLTLLLHDGIRVSEALTSKVRDFTEQASQPILWITGKRNVRRFVVLNAPTVDVLRSYLATRPPYEPGDPLFATAKGKKAWARSEAFRTVKMLAYRAGLASADRVGPHTMRHTFVTLSLANGAVLGDVQDAAGHADPAMTQRYNHGRHQMTNHPAHKLASVLALDDTPDGDGHE